MYMPWLKYLDPKIELISTQLPARGSRIFEPPYRDMETLVEDLSQEVVGLIDKPYAFFGYSLGAKIAYEVVIKLKERGYPLPRHFFATASPAPFLPRRRAPIHHLSDQEFMAKIGSYSGTPKELLQDQEMMELLLPGLRGDFSILENHQGKMQPVLNARLSIYGGEEDVDVNVEDLLAWSMAFKNTSHYQLYSGGHFFINTNLSDLVENVNSTLNTELAGLHLTEPS